MQIVGQGEICERIVIKAIAKAKVGPDFYFSRQTSVRLLVTLNPSMRWTPLIWARPINLESVLCKYRNFQLAICQPVAWQLRVASCKLEVAPLNFRSWLRVPLLPVALSLSANLFAQPPWESGGICPKELASAPAPPPPQSQFQSRLQHMQIAVHIPAQPRVLHLRHTSTTFAVAMARVSAINGELVACVGICLCFWSRCRRYRTAVTSCIYT